MSDAFIHNITLDAYKAGLQAEQLLAGVTREHKAAIQAELEALEGRTGLENRADVERATKVLPFRLPPAENPAQAPQGEAEQQPQGRRRADTGTVPTQQPAQQSSPDGR